MGSVNPIVLSVADAFTFDSIDSITPSFLGGSTLAEVLRSYDYLDRGIPNAPDFAASINRLGRAGMITVKSGRFKATPLGKRIAKRHRRRARGVIESAYQLGKSWEGITLDEILPSFEFVISGADYREAFGLPPA